MAKITKKAKAKCRRKRTSKQVALHLVVTRASGDQEKYLLAKVPSGVQAAELHDTLAKVVVPEHLVPFWVAVRGKKKRAA